jgi:TolB-like protein
MPPFVQQPGIASNDARAELSRVLASSEFAASRQLTNFLRYAVEELLAGREERLKERTLALGALGRDSSFDPRLDCIVRVVASKLRRALARYYAIDGASNPLCIDVPKGSYCPVIRRRCSRATNIGRERVRARVGSLRVDRSAASPILAVVPFRSFTSGPKERFLADLLAEDLAVRLSQFNSVELVDYLSMRMPEFEFEEPCAVASRLRADFVIAGTVRRVRRCVHLTVRLTDVRTGVLIWADQYEPQTDGGVWADKNELVDRIVASIGAVFDALRCTTPHARQPGSANNRQEGIAANPVVVAKLKSIVAYPHEKGCHPS